MEEVSGGVCAVRDVKASGVKEGNKGLALILGGGSAAGMFTANKLPAETVIFTKRQIKRSGRISAVIANSGCANSFTGEEGLRNAERMAELVADAFGIPKEEVAVASTGPIGKPLDMNLIERQFKEVAKTLTESPEGSTRAAKAIMTTDTFHKEIAVRISEEGKKGKKEGGSASSMSGAESVVVGGIAKGSGMIFPHLEATMLAFIYTDASLSANTLRECLREAVENSFNMIVVDGDMSTNDLVLLVSTGDAECEVSESAFKHGLNYVCEHLARMIARDGEGATKFIEVRVKGAASVEDARRAARAVIRSPLVKCSLFGEKPFWGRVIAALGASGVEIERKGLKMWFGSLERRGGSKASELVAANGKILNPPSARRFLRERELFLEIDLGVGGEGKARAWGCDFSYDYVKINS